MGSHLFIILILRYAQRVLWTLKTTTCQSQVRIILCSNLQLLTAFFFWAKPPVVTYIHDGSLNFWVLKCHSNFRICHDFWNYFFWCEPDLICNTWEQERKYENTPRFNKRISSQHFGKASQWSECIIIIRWNLHTNKTQVTIYQKGMTILWRGWVHLDKGNCYDAQG